MKNKYIVFPDSHAFQLWGKVWEPPCIKRNVKGIKWRVKFDANCLYSFGMPDQRDWNKGGGVSFDLFTNHKDSAMWGWRANDGGGIDLTAYCHVDGERKVFRDGLGEVVMVCTQGDSVEISLEIERDSGKYIFRFINTGKGQAWASIPFTHKKKWIRTIGAWFGGNQTAPHKMSIEIERKF